MVYLNLLTKYIISDLAEIVLDYLDTFCALCGRTFVDFNGYLVHTKPDYVHGECYDCAMILRTNYNHFEVPSVIEVYDF